MRLYVFTVLTAVLNADFAFFILPLLPLVEDFLIAFIAAPITLLYLVTFFLGVGVERLLVVGVAIPKDRPLE